MSEMTEADHKKELAKLKRLAVEIASEIHDIVEDTVWTNHVKMPELAEKLYTAVEKANSYKAEHSL
ncbi:CCE_0567 family metalloprotein [Sulfuricurvum sp.]|uniref:CCE_0567 family metalloprotein n=1 Tax=Sulfuricurvum sp. TaxID=2025608 RepID=UPI003BB1085E